MPNPSFLGYLYNPYMVDPYSGDTGMFAFGLEIQLLITDKSDARGLEVRRQIIDSLDARGLEVQRQVNSNEQAGLEVQRFPSGFDARGLEVQREILNIENETGLEVQRVINSSDSTGLEVHRTILDRADARGLEVRRFIVDISKALGLEIRRDFSIAHWFCEDGGYLQDEYLENPYLSPMICAQMGLEVTRTILFNDARGLEVRRFINGVKTFGLEVLRIIKDKAAPVGLEVNRIGAKTAGLQIRRVLYNTNRLRILCDFPSRGLTGINWTASSTAAGDFSENNLNTDIVEERWQSATGVTSATLICDTQIAQGVGIDTFAMLEHNLTTSAIVTIEGADNGSFSPVEQSFVLDPTKTNAYYIAPTFPTLQSRYWKITISDPTNPNNYLKIGTVLFGTATIFQGECFVDRVIRKRKHFADKVPTEGYTNVSNDRALKRAVSLEFRYLRYQKGNYKALDAIFEDDRTTIKCLWIPDPKDPPRFAVFGKLVTIPDEEHNNLGADASDTVNLTLEVDESL